MEILVALLNVGGPLYLVIAVLIGLLILATRSLWKKLSEERIKHDERYNKIVNTYHEKQDDVAKQMFEVITKNSEVISRQAESSNDLKESMKELRSAILFKKESN